ncbi:MAG TPA: hypothetical protein VK202_09875 [Bacteroidia bacterium]|nr:hypothetical protein [Bacteroidia bacterium]
MKKTKLRTFVLLYTAIILFTGCDPGGSFTVVKGTLTDKSNNKPVAYYPLLLRVRDKGFLTPGSNSYKTYYTKEDGSYEIGYYTESMTDYGIEADTTDERIGVWGYLVYEGRTNKRNIEIVPATKLHLSFKNTQNIYAFNRCELRPYPRLPIVKNEIYYTGKADGYFFGQDTKKVIRNINYRAYLYLMVQSTRRDTVLEFNIAVPDVDSVYHQINF